MFRTMMKSKLHRATVTEANLNYVGSITIDEDLMDQADLWANEKVQIVNNNNGARLETYIIPGPRGTGVICLNGAAARLVQPGDKVIIISYATMDEQEARTYSPKVVILDEENKPVQIMNHEVHATVL
ncbi:aspartate 1-decarboxylase [Paenibacillus pasadenensis]|uniref:aspartate 1-decarboxylase n=1 Tax=Paenibacillus pasadenensis TaxID=217090 RepID=UPI00203F38A1|nr:aspartate 1-decarboxylase [Paenibacillus pasadenensis]MCM3747505.1 aspartate 1-decarboxylase [Paenibacillus pasadenensis]